MGSSPCVFCKKEHPYSYEEAFAIMRKTSDTLRELLDAVSMEGFSAKKGDTWSPRQILIHLIDTEYAFGFRYRYIMAEKNPVVTPYEQNDWADTFTYGDLDATQLMRAFTPIRRVNLELLHSVDPSLYDKPAQHPQHGTISVGQMILHLAAHDLNHLQQIRDRIPAA